VILVIFLAYIVNLILSFLGNPLLNLVFEKFFEYVSKTWWAILIGLLIGGAVEVFVPQSLMSKWLGKSKKSILLAVVLGFLASACSHGILAIAISLFKKGASTAATLAFLLAAPWANLAITILLFSLFGIKAGFIVGGALLIAVLSGYIFLFLESRGIIEGQPGILVEELIDNPKLSKVSLKDKFRLVFVSAWSLTETVIWWVLLGFFVSSVLGSFLPESIFHQYFGINILGMIATLVIATIIEICSEGSAPMAFELFQKTGAFGNAFIFLQAGVVTDYTEFGIIWKNIGRKAAIALILSTVPLVLVAGYFLNKLTF
jgi:uncharacterized membrane protein YraQ (UPF0718 family)